MLGKLSTALQSAFDTVSICSRPMFIESTTCYLHVFNVCTACYYSINQTISPAYFLFDKVKNNENMYIGSLDCASCSIAARLYLPLEASDEILWQLWRKPEPTHRINPLAHPHGTNADRKLRSRIPHCNLIYHQKLFFSFCKKSRMRPRGTKRIWTNTQALVLSIWSSIKYQNCWHPSQLQIPPQVDLLIEEQKIKIQCIKCKLIKNWNFPGMI